MKKRLTIVISHPIQYHAPLYSYAQAKNLFDVHVIYHDDRGVRPYFEKLANSNVSYDNNLLEGYSHEFMLRGASHGLRRSIDHAYLPGLVKRIVASKPDAVYFHGYNSIAHIRAILSMKSRSIPVFLRGENEDVKPRPLWRNLLRESLLALLLPRFDAILYIGKENKEFFRRRGYPDHKLFFVPYSADNQYFGLDLTEDERGTIRREICAAHSIDPGATIFVNTCKHRESKRPMDLVLAYAACRKQLGPDAKAALLLVGDGPQNQELRQIVEAQGLQDVFFTGYVNQSKLRLFLLASDYCVNPAEEPWGCVFNEALPAGLGLISSDRVVGWPDMVREGENGFVYSFGNIDRLSAILATCVQNPAWRPVVASNSRKIASEYSYETCVRGLYMALQATAHTDHSVRVKSAARFP